MSHDEDRGASYHESDGHRPERQADDDKHGSDDLERVLDNLFSRHHVLSLLPVGLLQHLGGVVVEFGQCLCEHPQRV